KGYVLNCTGYLRYFIDLSDEQSANASAAMVGDALRATGVVAVKTTIKPYWKISEWFEVVIDVETQGRSAQVFLFAIQAIGTGWQMQYDCEAIWNDGDGSTFIDPHVRWAHFEFLEE